MEIDVTTIRKVAHLARLHITEEEIQHYRQEVSQILTWAEQLAGLNTDNITPHFSVHLENMPTREDRVTEGGNPKEVLANAPDQGLDMFATPKVVE